MFLVIIVAATLAAMAVCIFYALVEERSVILWGLLGMFFGIFAVATIVFLRYKKLMKEMMKTWYTKMVVKKDPERTLDD